VLEARLGWTWDDHFIRQQYTRKWGKCLSSSLNFIKNIIVCIPVPKVFMTSNSLSLTYLALKPSILLLIYSFKPSLVLLQFKFYFFILFWFFSVLFSTLSPPLPCYLLSCFFKVNSLLCSYFQSHTPTLFLSHLVILWGLISLHSNSIPLTFLYR